MNAPRVLVLVDSDSYVKWGAALASRMPPSWRIRLALARGTAEPTARQLDEALAGSGFARADLDRVDLPGLRDLLGAWRPDVLVLAARGLAVQTVVECAVSRRPDRPVLVSGLPGIAVPVLPYGLGFRRGVDLFILHSRREVRDFTAAAQGLGLDHRFALARLPFMEQPAPESSPVRDRMVFAAQALVPGSLDQRRHLLGRLVDTAIAHPDLEVVIKVRAHPGEAQTHDERHPYGPLLQEMSAERPVPPNLVVESGPMAAHLSRAVGLVTVSSTAILEAIGAGVPVLALDDYGVDARTINLVLQDSGLLATSDELVAGRFRQPDPAWCADHYFHDPDDPAWRDRDWVTLIEELVQRRSAEGLPPPVVEPNTLVHRVKMMFYRNLAFTQERSSLQSLTESLIVRISLRVARSRWIIERRFTPVDPGPAAARPIAPTTAEVAGSGR